MGSREEEFGASTDVENKSSTNIFSRLNKITNSISAF